MSKWIVELEKEVWLAPWEGDPGRTVVKDNARRFNTRLGALREVNRMRVQYSFRNFSLINIHEDGKKDNP